MSEFFKQMVLNEALRAEDMAHAKRVEAIYEAFFERGMLPEAETETIQLDAADKAIRGEA